MRLASSAAPDAVSLLKKRQRFAFFQRLNHVVGPRPDLTLNRPDNCDHIGNDCQCNYHLAHVVVWVFGRGPELAFMNDTATQPSCFSTASFNSESRMLRARAC